MEKETFLEEVVRELRRLRGLGEGALLQVSEEEFFEVDHGNSLAMLVKHVGGNLRSRWRDFLETDGEKPERCRDLEFVHEEDDERLGLMRGWDDGWETLFTSLETLTEARFWDCRVRRLRNSGGVVMSTADDG